MCREQSDSGEPHLVNQSILINHGNKILIVQVCISKDKLWVISDTLPVHLFIHINSRMFQKLL